MKKKEVTELYRIEWHLQYVGLFNTEYKTILVVINYQVLKETKASYQIACNGKLKWVRKNATVSYAYADIQDARRNFKRRNQKRLGILEDQLKIVKESLKLIENFHKPKTKK